MNSKSNSPVKNKKTLIIVLVLIILLLIGFFIFNNVKSDKYGMGKDKGSSENGIFTSVKDALTKKMTIACEFKDEKGSVVKSYIKNGAVRVTMEGAVNAEQSGEIIMKNNKMYMWNETTKQGFVYDIPDNEVTTDSKSVDSMPKEASQSENYLSMIEEYKDSCKVATVEDSYFTVPSDVNFQDMSKFLEEFKNKMPSGAPNY